MLYSRQTMNAGIGVDCPASHGKIEMEYTEIPIALDGAITMRTRLYRGGAKTPVVCIPGLTRNAADFADLAPNIAADGHDVLVLSLRGRGASDYDPHYLNYRPETYRDDVLRALDHMSWDSAIFIGTSLGGIVTMLTAQTHGTRIRAGVLNDIGPEVAAAGIARIIGYTSGGAAPQSSLQEAAECMRAVHQISYPDASDDDWIKWAKRTFRETPEGTFILDYDPMIPRAILEGGAAADLWPGWRALAPIPTLVVRGAISDILSVEIVEKMRAERPDFDYIEAPRIGHAPFMTEDTVWPVLRSFISKLG